MVFCDKICYRWTVNKQEGYYSYSELFLMHFGPSYGCDKMGRVYPKPGTRTVNYGNLMQILKSSDEALFTQNAWIWDGDFKFLDGSHRLLQDEGNHVWFTSYPRSGNSFLRRYVEQISGIATGSA